MPQKQISRRCFCTKKEKKNCEIKANTLDVYFGLISPFVCASRTKRENHTKPSELRRVQLNPTP